MRKVYSLFFEGKGLWLLFLLYECVEEKDNSNSYCYISNIENGKISHSNKISNRTKQCSFNCIQKTTRENHEVSDFLEILKFSPRLPEKYSDNYENERDNPFDTRQGSTEGNTSIFDMRDTENISNDRKIWIRNIDPVFREDIGENYSYKKWNIFFHILFLLPKKLFLPSITFSEFFHDNLITDGFIEERWVILVLFWKREVIFALFDIRAKFSS